MKIKKGDTVKIISGKDRGKTGKVTHVFPKKNLIVVEGINIRKKHTRPKKQGKKGQIIQMSMPIDMSNAMIICPSCGKPTRVGKKKKVRAAPDIAFDEVKGGRVCKKCNAEL
jgi:large subunit ribosomal protein L24